MGQPPVKFSSGLLNKKYKLKYLVKAKKYSQAKELQEDIRGQEKIETDQAHLNFLRSIDKLREGKQKKHSSEYEAVKARLEKSINSKLKQRMTEYEQLLLRIQNCHNDMMNRQSVEFGKIQSIHAKLLAKYSLNIDDIANRYEHIQEEDPRMIQEEEEFEDAGSKEQYPHLQKGNFSKHLESSSQGEMKIVEENFEEESSMTNGKHFNHSGKKLLQVAESEEMRTQGQINGYWKKDHIEDFAQDEQSNAKPEEPGQREQTNGFNNFRQIESNQGSSRSNSVSGKSGAKSSRSQSRSSSSSSSSSRSSSSSSSSDSDSD